MLQGRSFYIEVKGGVVEIYRGIKYFSGEIKMTESEAEEQETPVLTPELLPEQKFHVMVKEANLDESRAAYLLKQFSGHFKDAAEYAKKYPLINYN